MSVLVVARTRMAGDRVCVGAIDLETHASLRLLGSDGRNLPGVKPIRPGEIWEHTYTPATHVEPPHRPASSNAVLSNPSRRRSSVDPSP